MLPNCSKNQAEEIVAELERPRSSKQVLWRREQRQSLYAPFKEYVQHRVVCNVEISALDA